MELLLSFSDFVVFKDSMVDFKKVVFSFEISFLILESCCAPRSWIWVDRFVTFKAVLSFWPLVVLFRAFAVREFIAPLIGVVFRRERTGWTVIITNFTFHSVEL